MKTLAEKKITLRRVYKKIKEKGTQERFEHGLHGVLLSL